MKTRDRDVVVAALKHAAPYIRMYKRKVFVIKAGGELFINQASTRALLEQVAILHQVGIRVVLVHGSGPQSTQLAKDRGLATNMIEGRRVTDAATLEVSQAASQQISNQIVTTCAELNLAATSLDHSSGLTIKAIKRPPVEVEGVGTVDYGFVGDIEAIDSDAITAILDTGKVPVVSPLTADANGNILNINADTIAATLASALEAEKLILATGAIGILEDIKDPHSLVSYVDLAGLQQLRENGSLADGMLPKAKAIEIAISGGVTRVHVISYAIPDCLLLEIFTNEGTGTLVVNSIAALTEAEQAIA
ncbi:MAG: acetylglutamate kinase [Gammaproteobacteria bacterium]|nr:acetylglutamate kinase [Gammaproteobacteria bacterium]